MKKKLQILFIILSLSISSLYATYPKVALVLSGGGAKGFAEVAVVEEIQKLGIPIDFICGTSMGGLIGAYYALGYTSKDIKTMIHNNSLFNAVIDTPNTYSVTPPSLIQNDGGLKISFGFNEKGIGNNPGLLSDQGIVSFINKSTIKSPGNVDFSTLYIPFKAMATDITTGSEKVIESGYISDAMRATMSLPIIFPPYLLRDGTYCMDGGLVDNLPVQLAQDWGADIIISVDVSSDGLQDIEAFSSLSGAAIQTSRLVTFGNREESQKASDIVIKPEVGEYLVLDIAKFDEILEKGYEAFEENKEALIKIRDDIKKYRELEFVTEDTISHYSTILDPLINSVKFVGVNFDKTYSYTNIFNKYINNRLDENYLEQLENDIHSFASLNGISTVSFNYQPTNVIDNAGILEIDMRDWNTSPSKIDFSTLLKTGFSSNSLNRAWFYYLFNIHSSIREIVADNITIDLNLSVSETTNVNAKIGTEIYNDNEYEMIGFFHFATKLGSLSPANNKYVTNYVPSYNYGFTVGAGYDLRFSNKLSFEALLGYSLVALNSTTLPSGFETVSFEDSLINSLEIDLSFAFLNSENSLFSNYGYGVNGIATFFFNDKNKSVYINMNGKYDFNIDKINSLKLNFGLGFSTANYQLTSSYFDLGGYTNIPGFYFGAFTREYTFLGLAYQRNLYNIYRDLYFQAGFKFYGYDKYNPITHIYTNPGNFMIDNPNNFPSITEVGVGIYSGIGLKTEFGDIVFGAGYSINGNFSLVMEFV